MTRTSTTSASCRPFLPGIGQVVSVTTLRPNTVIKDQAIPTLLLKVAQPTFVTTNATDFWKRVQPHNAYCIVAREVPDMLRRLFRHSDLKTKASRMGKVVRLTSNRIEYYEFDGQVHALS